MNRDRILEQALKHELRRTPAPATPACLDAETLAAWFDEGLDIAATEAADTHIAHCAHCLAHVAVLARSASAVSTPVTVGAQGTSRSPGTHAALSWWKWLTPLAAGAAAVTLWMVVPKQHEKAVAPYQASGSAPAQAPAPAEVTPQSRGAESVAPPPAAAPPLPSVAAPPPALARDRSAMNERKRSEPRESLAAAGEDPQQKLADAAPKREAAAEAGLAPAPPAPMPRAAAAESAPQAAPSIGAAQKSTRLSSVPLEIISPVPSRRWRVTAGAIERSEDGGQVWLPVRPATGDTITGGTSPGATICWLIGPGGLVLVTADGMRFARVPLPEPLELTAIAATDARTATVTAADGRRFTTNDSGRTWRQN